MVFNISINFVVNTGGKSDSRHDPNLYGVTPIRIYNTFIIHFGRMV